MEENVDMTIPKNLVYTVGIPPVMYAVGIISSC